MQDLKYWKNKIQEKRKTTKLKDFIKEVASWVPVSFNKNDGMISRYPQSDRINVCSLDDFNKNIDSNLNKGIDYDFEVDFFKNFQNLFSNVPLGRVFHFEGVETSDYADIVWNSKNAYLSFTVVDNCEDTFYTFCARTRSSRVFNTVYSVTSENVYMSAGITDSFKIFYSKFIKNSSDIWFSSNLTGCNNCILCSNLENKKYYIFNKEYSKEEYIIESSKILKEKHKFLSYYKNIDKIGKDAGSSNSTGSFVINSENVENGFFSFSSKDCKNIFFNGSDVGNENFYDVFSGGSGKCSDFYSVALSGGGSDNLYFSSIISSSSNLFYSYLLEHCSFCIGCVGLRNKSYCILNKQYSKEEWEYLADKIFLQMEKDKIFGKFFPGNINPFNFNDTIAGLIGGYKKEEIEKEGYMWRNETIKVDILQEAEIVEIKNLNQFQGFDSDGNWQITPEILRKVISSENGNYYKILKKEYDFLVKYALPLPEIHWLDRIRLGLGL